MKSSVVKRSIVIDGHRTSVSLEDDFWNSLKEIAANRSQTLSELISTIDTDRRYGNLSSAIRLSVLHHFRNLSAPSHFSNEEKRMGVPKVRFSSLGAEGTLTRER